MPTEHITDFAGTYGDDLPEWLERAALSAGLSTSATDEGEGTEETV